eukprot:2609995-Rhodomonas_salina.1
MSRKTVTQKSTSRAKVKRGDETGPPRPHWHAPGCLSCHDSSLLDIGERAAKQPLEFARQQPRCRAAHSAT